MPLERYLVKATKGGHLIERRVVEADSMEQALAALKAKHGWRGGSLSVMSEQVEGQFDNVVPFTLEQE